MTDAEPSTSAGPGDQRSSGIERRRVFVLLNIWRSLAGPEGLPARDDVSEKTVGELWDLCFILDLKQRRDNPVFTHFGRQLIDLAGVDLTGRPRSYVPVGNVLDYASLYFSRVAREGVPVSEGGEIRDDQGRRVLFRSILLPLGRARHAVDALLGIATYKVAGT